MILILSGSIVPEPDVDDPTLFEVYYESVPEAQGNTSMTSSTRRAADPSADLPANASQREIYPSDRYAWYVVGVLTLAYIFSFIDRQILNMMVGPIMRDLHISLTQMSLLQGFSFAVFYTFFGIPLGRLADSKSRRTIIICGITFWSLMTAACGLAQQYWQLMIMRMGVGVGEASLSPSAYSLIADYFRPEKRATANGVYGMGIYLGAGIATILTGLVAEYTSGAESIVLPLVGALRPWQTIFFIVGLPGLLVALILTTVREPLRKGMRQARSGEPAVAEIPLKEVWGYIGANRRTFFCLNLGIAFMTLAGYGGLSMIPELMATKHNWTKAQVGLIYGMIYMVFGSMGILFGGRLADRLRQKGATDATLRVALLGATAALPLCLYALMPTGTWVMVMLAPAIFFTSMAFGVAPAAIQQMMPNTMRGQASAIYLFVINLIGLGCGPTAVALIADKLFKNVNKLDISIAIVCLISHLIAIALLSSGLRPYRRSLDYLAEWEKAQI